MPTTPPLIKPPMVTPTWTWWRCRAANARACFQTIHNISLTGLAGATTWAAALMVTAIPKLQIAMNHEWTIEELQIFSWSGSTLLCSRVVPIGVLGTRGSTSLPAPYSGILAFPTKPHWWRDLPRWSIPGVSFNYVSDGRPTAQYQLALTNFGLSIIAPIYGGLPHDLMVWRRKTNVCVSVNSPIIAGWRSLAYRRSRRDRADHMTWPVYPTV